MILVNFVGVERELMFFKEVILVDFRIFWLLRIYLYIYNIIMNVVCKNF